METQLEPKAGLPGSLEAKTSKEKLHPFEAAGMGSGPFTWIGSYSFPSPSLAELHPAAYQSALSAMPRDLINGCGTCANCGKAINNIEIVQNSEGRRYGVGCDCVMKTDDPSLSDKAKIAQKLMERSKRRALTDAKRVANRAKWLSSVCNDRGETNEQRIAREAEELTAKRESRISIAVEKWGFMLPILDYHQGSGFCTSIADGIRNHGSEPSGGAIEILSDIYGRQYGRRNSKAYNSAREEFEEKIK